MRRTRGTGRAGLLCIALFVLALCAAPSAQAFIYWANTGTTIGRATPNGGAVDQNFLASGQACGVAVDGKHIYWTGHADGGTGTGTIGRANLDGSHARPNFITGASNPCGLAVDRAHIYWSHTVSAGGIGRANLNGSGVDQSFVATNGHACGVAVDRAHLYWANRDFGTIGRSNLNGSPASVNQSFILGGTNICGVAVDRAHVYWADRDLDAIGRANLNGSPSSVDQTFIPGATNPCGLAVDRFHVYWANSFTSQIGRANINGSGVDQSLLPANIPCFVAVDTSNAFTFGKLKRHPRRGTATQTVKVPGPGRLVLFGRQVRRATDTAQAAGKVKMPVRAKGAATADLNATGSSTVRFKVTFTPSGGYPKSKPKTVTLIKRP